MKKISVLILCTGNSCRSQMAEGVMKHYGKDRFDVESAGIQPSRVNPLAMAVMKEIGIDISTHRSKHLDEFKDRNFDYIITVCDHAQESCPAYLKAGQKLHWSFPDPPHGQEATPEVTAEFRMVRDMIHARFRQAAEHGFE